ncbi:MAG: hypothetical protein CL483_03015 [Acidobacteria bacterium]|nr:hypothetical protein [Acidobacteriota bacterium]|tara:strand:+ start:698 stop:1879 length:1182 start_codon:yes stop_codon:yes gene_type:complete
MTVFAQSAPAAFAPDVRASSANIAVPWHLWAVAFASTSVMIGVIWDISWHRTIGRDTFWTPAHLAIYLGGTVAGLACGWLVLRTTFAGSVKEKAAGVTFWGFRGPLGAWVCIWGSLAMITSAPLDDWWHNAYGLDVQILSPPHAVLAAGILSIQIGAMLIALAQQNTAGEKSRTRQLLFLYSGGVFTVMLATLGTEEIAFANSHHGNIFFVATALMFPPVLVAISRSAIGPWGATTAAAVYMGATMLMIWILQLFPAQPMLAPILRQVDQMVPPPFPLLLVVAGVGVDLVLRHLPDHAGRPRQWTTAVVAGLAGMAAFGLAQWLFAEFLLSPGARNFFFAADQWDYNTVPGNWQYEFRASPLTGAGLVLAAVVAAATSLGGLGWGNWMSRVRR